MLKIIFNTTPILSLLKINKLNILKELYGEIIIPYSVYKEIEVGKNKEYYLHLKKISWIEIVRATNTNLYTDFNKLDKGELEVFQLYIELKADLVVIDEKIARDLARKNGIKHTGLIGILLKVKKLNLIENVSDLLIELKNKNTFISDKIVNQILEIENNL